MKLSSVRVSNFRSIEDSGEFAIGDLNCLVGKNEAGKTAILQALWGLDPLGDFKYDKVRDYPRRFLARFDERYSDGECTVVTTNWKLEDGDLGLISDKFGPQTLESDVVTVSKGFGLNETRWAIQFSDLACVEFLLSKYKLDDAEREPVKGCESSSKLFKALTTLDTPSERQQQLKTEIAGMRDKSARLSAIDMLSARKPQFFYTSHFERMSGEIALNKLATDKQNNNLQAGDKIFLDFLTYAGTSLEELQQTSRYEELIAKCEGASNEITDEIFEFWSQNEALAVKIELGEGRPQDPPPFNSGTIAKVRIENRNHRVTVPLSERSAGFIWFFSFLSQFKQLKASAGQAILLLDEPGLTLHGKAQADLLKYIQERLLPTHQVIYTTHSPFMIPSERLSDVRVVEDVLERDERNQPIVKGTKVSENVLSVDKATLFPLQGHLGYEITQSLFIGKNTLLVEGPSDILYLQVFSQALKNRGKSGLGSSWVICPTGGIDKIWSFVSLFGGNKLNIAVLCDYGSGSKKKVENLRQSQILKLSQIFTACDFTGKSESDVEDFISNDLYAVILNQAFRLPSNLLISADQLSHKKSGEIRLVKAAESIFRTMPPDIQQFDHFTPAEWLIRNPSVLDNDTTAVSQSLAKFEDAFECLNKLLSSVSQPASSVQATGVGAFTSGMHQVRI